MPTAFFSTLRLTAAICSGVTCDPARALSGRRGRFAVYREWIRLSFLYGLQNEIQKRIAFARTIVYNRSKDK